MRTLTALVLVVSSLAFAQTEAPAPTQPKPAKPQTIIFGQGSDITGEPDFPELTLYEVPPKAKFQSLIKLRTNFNDKLLQSVHEM